MLCNSGPLLGVAQWAVQASCSPRWPARLPAVTRKRVSLGHGDGLSEKTQSVGELEAIAPGRDSVHTAAGDNFKNLFITYASGRFSAPDTPHPGQSAPGTPRPFSLVAHRPGRTEERD